MYATPHWVDRRHGWEPVNKMSKTKKPVTFRIKRSARTKQFRCVVVAGNGEAILTGESCKNRKDVQDTITNLISAIMDGQVEVIDETKAAPKKPKHYEGKPRSGKWP